MHCQYGELIQTLPEGFVPYQQWPEYHTAADIPKILHPIAVGKNPTGTRRGIWPLFVEEYVSDTEPDLLQSDPDQTAPNRIIKWHRVVRQDIPHGWRAFLQTPSRIEGFAEVFPHDAYWTHWSESARRYRKKWTQEFLGKKYTIEPIPFEEFAASYKQGTISNTVKKIFLEKLALKLLLSKDSETITLWGVRDIQTARVVAGMATITSPQHKASYYLCGFIHPAAEHDPVMLGVMDHWFGMAQKNGILFLHFGCFWKKGDPVSWKGFSTFKSKFGLQYIAYPPILVRIARGNIF